MQADSLNDFFFVCTTDKISAVILTRLINIHPDIQCNMVASGLLNESLDYTLEGFITDHKTDKKFTGNIYNFPAYELQFQMTEYSEAIFRKVNILVSPILRINFFI